MVNDELIILLTVKWWAHSKMVPYRCCVSTNGQSRWHSECATISL